MLCRGFGCLSVCSARLRATRFGLLAKNGRWSSPAARSSSSSAQSGQQPSARLPFEVDTNVAKHTEIYRFDNFKAFASLRMFTVVQLFLWSYMANYCYTVTDPTEGVPPDVEKSGRVGGLLEFLRERLTTDRYRYGLVALCTTVGSLVVAGSSLFVLRSVRSIVLLKGGQRVLVQTYAPFRDLRGLEVPLEHINCLQSRLRKSSYITLKVKGHWFYFMLDQRGIFPHPKLFDNTVGISRKF
uniref:Putative conserved plasma membrane protein n=1 Tax=Amblyomma aureolatum TaxID=187763 RepID=A0A1E1X8E1_9ACAR